jgi:hypothetical protein
MGACMLGPERSPVLRWAPRRYARALLSDWGDGERGVEAERAQKAICSPSAPSLGVSLQPAQTPVLTAESVSLRKQDGGGGSGRGARGDRKAGFRPPSQTPGYLTEGKNDMSAGTLSERALTGRVESAPPWLTGGASDGREPHSQAAPQAKWSLRIQAEPPYLQRLRRTAPSTSPGGVRACSCRHRGEEGSVHTDTTVIAKYVISFNCKTAHYTTRPDLGCSGKDLLLYAIHGTASPMMPHHVSRPTRVLSNWFEWQRARLKLKAGLPRLLLSPPSR